MVSYQCILTGLLPVGQSGSQHVAEAHYINPHSVYVQQHFSSMAQRSKICSFETYTICLGASIKFIDKTIRKILKRLCLMFKGCVLQ